MEMIIPLFIFMSLAIFSFYAVQFIILLIEKDDEIKYVHSDGTEFDTPQELDVYTEMKIHNA